VDSDFDCYPFPPAPPPPPPPPVRRNSNFLAIWHLCCSIIQHFLRNMFVRNHIWMLSLPHHMDNGDEVLKSEKQQEGRHGKSQVLTLCGII
jgi:hypothetical protein